MAVQPTPGDHAHTIALCNPFSEEAVGAKIPDDDSTKSVAVTVKDTFPMNTDSNGRADCRFSPRVGGNVALHATVSGSAGVTTWGTGNTLTDLAAYQGAFDSYRIVGWGLKVTNLLPPTDRSGYFRVITCPEDPGAVTPYITNGGLHEDIKIFPASEDDIHWISKPVGSQYKLYNQWTGDVPVWDYCHVRYEGGPASKAAAILVQVVFHLECQIELGKVTATMATAAAPHKPHVLTAAANTLAKHGGAHAGSTFGGLISRFAKSALQGAVNHFLPGFYGGPSYPSIMNVD
jgi:hypothetical protein